MASLPLIVSERPLSLRQIRASLTSALSALAYFSFVIAMLGLMWFAPRAHQNVAVLVSPFAAPSVATEVAAQAQAEVIDRSRWPNLLIVRQHAPDTVRRLYASGAWLVFNPNAVAGCF